MYQYKGSNGLSEDRIPKTVLNVKYKDKFLKTSLLYRYNIIDDNLLKISTHKIEDIRCDRIYFNRGYSISIKAIGKCKLGNINSLYLPTRDDEYAKHIFIHKYMKIINESKDKINKYENKINMIHNIKLADE